MKTIIKDKHYVSNPTYSVMIGEDHYKGGYWITHTKQSMHRNCYKHIKICHLFINLMEKNI